jgi:teichoic acid transport system permease protein
MGNRGRLIAPGGLRDDLAAVAEDEPAAGESLAEMAAQYGLRPSSARPRLVFYLVKVWQRRHFILAYATARNVSMYTEARLGQLWQVLTPLLNSAVYYLIFGVLFKANRGISNYTAYLVTGVFIFAFTERSIVVGSTVMRANIALIRALHFPRACLPLAYVLVEFQQLLLSMVVLFAIVLGTGEPLTWYWLLLLPTLLLQATFNMGAALFMARVGAGAQDISQLIPFLLRVWRYFCGVMYSIAALPAALPEWGVVVDLVAGHVQLGCDPAGRQQGGQLGHLQGVPARRELARVHQPERGARRLRAAGAGYVRQHRRQQYAFAAGRGDAALQEAAELLGLAQQVPRRRGDQPELGGTVGRQAGHRLRDVGQVRPQPPGERLAPGRRQGHRAAAQHHQVVRLVGVEPGQQLDRGGRPQGTRAVGPVKQVLLERSPHGDAGLGQQRRDQPAGADGCLQHQRHRAAGPRQRLRHRLEPDGRPVDQVQVDVAVDERPRSQR